VHSGEGNRLNLGPTVADAENGAFSARLHTERAHAMRNHIAAAVAVLAFVIAGSTALASTQTVTVKATGLNYLISGKAPQVGKARVATIEILSNGKQVAYERRFHVPSAADHYAFWLLAKQSDLPSGNYVLDIVKVVGSKKSNITFPFTIS
jgi:hypothetical protein